MQGFAVFRLTTLQPAATVLPNRERIPSLAKKKLDFEATLSELETLVERMESGDLSLEDSLAAFERGVKLTRECQSALSEAELRVKTLTATAAEPDEADDGD